MLADLIVSLGPNCRSSWNLRNHFRVERAYPFDWWITPARAMLGMISEGFRFSIAPDDVEALPTGDGRVTFYNSKYNILQHHDFHGRVDAQRIPSLNEKFGALFDRLHSDIAEASSPVALLDGVNPGWEAPFMGDPSITSGTDPCRPTISHAK